MSSKYLKRVTLSGMIPKEPEYVPEGYVHDAEACNSAVFLLRADGHIREELRNQGNQIPQRRGSAGADQNRSLAAVKGPYLLHHAPGLSQHPPGTLHRQFAVWVEGELVFLPVKEGNL